MEAGGLLSLGPDRHANYRRAAYFVDAILHGFSPADLPVESGPVELVVNLRAADALGLTIPVDVLQETTDIVTSA